MNVHSSRIINIRVELFGRSSGLFIPSPRSSRFKKREQMRARLLQIEIKKCRTGFPLLSLTQPTKIIFSIN